MNMKQAGSIVVLVLYGMNELHSLMCLAELGPAYHNPAVKIDILLDVPPPSSVSWVNSRILRKVGKQLEQPHSAAALKTWSLNTETSL